MIYLVVQSLEISHINESDTEEHTMIITNIKEQIPEVSTEVFPDGMNPATDLRSDLWLGMTAAQLANQHDLVLTKLSGLSSIVGPSASPSLLHIYGALQFALADLTSLMDTRAT